MSIESFKKQNRVFNNLYTRTKQNFPPEEGEYLKEMGCYIFPEALVVMRVRDWDSGKFFERYSWG